MEQNKIKLNIVSPIFDLCGYSRHGRELVNALDKIGVDVRLETTKPDQWERYVNDAELKMIAKPFDSERISLMIGQPPYWRLEMAKKPKKFFGCCVWEGDKIPKYWIPFLVDSRVDKILVPSEHTKQAILKTVEEQGLGGTNLITEPEFVDKIVIIPHGVRIDVFYPMKAMENLKNIENEIKDKPNPFTFVANKGWSEGMYDRGGIQFLLQAFTEEFKEEENVCLKIKLNSTYNKPGWDLKEEIAKLNLKKTSKVLITMDMINDDALRRFYNEGDVFVSTSMGEAFNLPCLEAMACGLPVISTIGGGQLDFINKKNGFLIDKGSLEYWSKDVIYEDVRWFKPDIKQIQQVLRFCYDNRQKMNNYSLEALKTAKKFTWESVAIKLKNLLPN